MASPALHQSTEVSFRPFRNFAYRRLFYYSGITVSTFIDQRESRIHSELL